MTAIHARDVEHRMLHAIAIGFKLGDEQLLAMITHDKPFPWLLETVIADPVTFTLQVAVLLLAPINAALLLYCQSTFRQITLRVASITPSHTKRVGIPVDCSHYTPISESVVKALIDYRSIFSYQGQAYGKGTGGTGQEW
ncbi:hypothetical protein GCM10022278_03930 [Allohahella marinimesophila]|uniref:Uncharacterized protein n=1 Tax=Allohahella marinimesophila TaxID=1054972 RepID=A0ABP7NIH4_9GAMM